MTPSELRAVLVENCPSSHKCEVEYLIRRDVKNCATCERIEVQLAAVIALARKSEKAPVPEN